MVITLWAVETEIWNMEQLLGMTDLECTQRGGWWRSWNQGTILPWFLKGFPPCLLNTKADDRTNNRRKNQ